jgi:peptidyl-prolyl cis-trans isomerase C
MMQRQYRNIAVALVAGMFALAAGAQDEPKKAPKKAAAAKSESSGSGRVVVNGVTIPQSRIEAMNKELNAQGQPDSAERQQAVREELINREVVAQEAQRSGLARNPEVASQLDMARQEVLVGAFIRDYMRRNPVSDAEVQKEYDHAKSQAGGKEYKARHILVDSEEKAKSLIAELKKGASFEDLAAKNSQDPGSAQQGGDLDWNVPTSFDKQFSDAMVKLEKGKYTEQPVHSRFGYHIIRLDDVRATKFPPLADVAPRLKQKLAQQHVESMVRSLRAKAKVE